MKKTWRCCGDSPVSARPPPCSRNGLGKWKRSCRSCSSVPSRCRSGRKCPGSLPACADVASWFYHECTNIDLAIRVTHAGRAGSMRKVCSDLIRELVDHDIHLSIANHHFCLHLIDAGTNRYLGMVCHYNMSQTQGSLPRPGCVRRSSSRSCPGSVSNRKGSNRITASLCSIGAFASDCPSHFQPP